MPCNEAAVPFVFPKSGHSSLSFSRLGHSPSMRTSTLEMSLTLTDPEKISAFPPDVLREHLSLGFSLCNQKPVYAAFMLAISMIHHLKVSLFLFFSSLQ